MLAALLFPILLATPIALNYVINENDFERRWLDDPLSLSVMAGAILLAAWTCWPALSRIMLIGAGPLEIDDERVWLPSGESYPLQQLNSVEEITVPLRYSALKLTIAPNHVVRVPTEFQPIGQHVSADDVIQFVRKLRATP